LAKYDRVDIPYGSILYLGANGTIGSTGHVYIDRLLAVHNIEQLGDLALIQKMVKVQMRASVLKKSGLIY
jgi:hypothetical protein